MTLNTDPRQFRRVMLFLVGECVRKGARTDRVVLSADKPTREQLKHFYESHGEAIREAVQSWQGEGRLPDIKGEGEGERFFAARISAAGWLLQSLCTEPLLTGTANPIVTQCSDADLIRWLLTDWFDQSGAQFLFAYQSGLQLIRAD